MLTMGEVSLVAPVGIVVCLCFHTEPIIDLFFIEKCWYVSVMLWIGIEPSTSLSLHSLTSLPQPPSQPYILINIALQNHELPCGIAPSCKLPPYMLKAPKNTLLETCYREKAAF